jgi:hypothetical protein
MYYFTESDGKEEKVQTPVVLLISEEGDPVSGGPGVPPKRHRVAYLVAAIDPDDPKRAHSVLTRLLQKAVDFGCSKLEADRKLRDVDEGELEVEEWNGEEWTPRASVVCRSPESVVIPSALRERLKKDATEFASSKKWYFQNGVPYRRSYLFHGPPGSGKTSYVQVLASDLDRQRICILNLVDKGMTDKSLCDAISTAPDDSIILLEDIDAIFTTESASRVMGIGSPNLSFSGLLRALDGIDTPNNVVFVLTSNHPEKLDPALVRDGRVHVSAKFDWIVPEQSENMFKRFKSGDNDNVDNVHARNFARSVEQEAKVSGIPVSASEVQSHFITSRGLSSLQASTFKRHKKDFGNNSNKRKNSNQMCGDDDDDYCDKRIKR